MLLTFFLTPLLLRYLGAANFGTYKVLAELHGHLSLLEFGLYSSLLASLMPLLKENRLREQHELLEEGRRQYLWSAVLTALAACALIPLLPWLTSWTSKSVSELYLTFFFMALTAALIPFQPYRIFLEASNQGHRVNLIVFLQNLSFMLVGTVFAFYGYGLLSQGIAILLSSMLGVGLMRYFAGRKIALSLRKHDQYSALIRKYQKPQVLNDLANKLCLNCDQLIIAAMLGPVVVTKVFLGQRLTQIIQGQLQSIGQASFASLGALYYSEQEIFRKRFLEVTKLLCIVALATLVPLCVLNRPFISLWIGDAYQMESNALTYLSAANAFLYALFSFWSLVFTVLGKPGELTAMQWRQAIINVIASLAFTYWFGGVGPIAGTLVSFILVPTWTYPQLLARHFNMPLYPLVATVMLPFGVGILLLTALHFSPWQLWPMSWFELIAWGAVLFGTLSSVLFVMLFNREEKKLFFNRLGPAWQKILRK